MKDKQAALRLAIVNGKIFWADPPNGNGTLYVKNGERMFCLYAGETSGDDCCAPEGYFNVEEITDEAQKKYYLKEAAKYYAFVLQNA